ncbi:hypothetical protein ABZ370_18490 [Streptomyces sp. NPDC005962]|uniref:hypothetical protein n=1 Tax=Streptomyces sp. NPDC005962 TaxID=3154466 RepID=UPI0033DB8D58
MTATGDATGNQLLRSSPSETTFYLPGMELHQNKSTGAITATRYYSLGDQTIAVRDTGGVTFLSGDHHGTAQLAVDAVTGQTQRRRLDPFGQVRDDDSSPASPWVDDKGFVGGTNDDTSGTSTVRPPLMGRTRQELGGGSSLWKKPPIGVAPSRQVQDRTRGGDVTHFARSRSDPAQEEVEPGAEVVAQLGVHQCW